MKIKILEYRFYKGNKVRVQSHNYRKGKWIENPNWEWHKKVARGDTMMQGAVTDIKEYSKEIKK